jgi:hypothetical protein
LVSLDIRRLREIPIQGNWISLFSLIPSSHVFAGSLFFFVGLFQREISVAADNAARVYRENTPEDRRFACEIWDAMTKAQERFIKTIRSRNFEKYISVAHKDNGDDFFHEVPLLPHCIHFLSQSSLHVVFLDVSFLFFLWQIDRHFSSFLVPDMTIEKLQKVATSHVDAHFKAKWLR